MQSSITTLPGGTRKDVRKVLPSTASQKSLLDPRSQQIPCDAMAYDSVIFCQNTLTLIRDFEDWHPLKWQ